MTAGEGPVVKMHRTRLLAGLTLLATLGAVLAFQLVRGPAAAAARTRARLENTRKLWTASLVAAANPASSYAAVTVPGGARWVELLVSAGVPARHALGERGAKPRAADGAPCPVRDRGNCTPGRVATDQT